MDQGTYAPTADGRTILMVQSEPEKKRWWVDAELPRHMENGFVADYDANVSYGFWGRASAGRYGGRYRPAVTRGTARIDEFDGATLTVTVTFADGTERYPERSRCTPASWAYGIRTMRVGPAAPPARYSPTSRPKSRAISTAYTRRMGIHAWPFVQNHQKLV